VRSPRCLLDYPELEVNRLRHVSDGVTPLSRIARFSPTKGAIFSGSRRTSRATRRFGRFSMPLFGYLLEPQTVRSCPKPDVEVQGLQQGLKGPRRSKTEQKRGTATRQTAVKTSICDRRITYEPGGRGFKSCRARQIPQALSLVPLDDLSSGGDFSFC
jgi:hypothetical protein